MKLSRPLQLSILVLIFAAGCSSLPGLKVLTGEDTGNTVISGDNPIDSINLVMADKTDATNPALIAIADRIEAASQDVDIIEIRSDTAADEFVINLMLRPPSQNMTNQEYTNMIRRAVEVTWQGSLRESSGSDKLKINILQPLEINTLDHGMSFIGRVDTVVEISRSDAISYLSSAHSTNDFIQLIVDGVVSFEPVNDFQVYNGEPNHPMFLVPSNPQQVG